MTCDTRTAPTGKRETMSQESVIDLPGSLLIGKEWKLGSADPAVLKQVMPWQSIYFAYQALLHNARHWYPPNILLPQLDLAILSQQKTMFRLWLAQPAVKEVMWPIVCLNHENAFTTREMKRLHVPSVSMVQFAPHLMPQGWDPDFEHTIEGTSQSLHNRAVAMGIASNNPIWSDMVKYMCLVPGFTTFLSFFLGA